MTPNYVKPYKEMMIDSDQLEVPRSTYQRRQEPSQIVDISTHFDERIANEPKVSFRDGRYFVFDGQHTIAARVHKNGGNPLPILCKVYFGMTEKEEALLFAAQYLADQNGWTKKELEDRYPVTSVFYDSQWKRWCVCFYTGPIEETGISEEIWIDVKTGEVSIPEGDSNG